VSNASLPASEGRSVKPARWLARIRTAIASSAAIVGALLFASAANAHLQDDFNRADSATIGNGWIEKNPNAFSIQSNRLIKNAVPTGYRDNVVYRPNSEDSLDVEAAIEFRLTGLPAGYAQVFTRLQASTVSVADRLDGYMLYLEDSTSRAILGRQTGTDFVTTLATITISPALNTTDQYRLRLRTTGTAPVALEAYVERQVGAEWQVIGQATATDSAGNRIATAGAVGFGGYVESTYVMDNFTRVDLGASGTTNPLPTTAGLAPQTATAGESGLTLVVYGSGFTTDSVVRWNGSARATTYVSPSELEADITAADLASPGSVPVTVFNPAPAGGTSTAQSFQITAPGVAPPTLTSLDPTTIAAGGAGFTLTVTGTNFDASSVVRWNGAARPTTFVSATQLQAAIPASDIAATTTASITVLRASDSLVTGTQVLVVTPPSASADFTDNFNRANSADVGNGWIEKSPSAFSLDGNEVAKIGAGGSDYRNNIVYRPASENLLDVEASVELRALSTAIGYPQVLVRAQTDTIATTNMLDAYLLYMAESNSTATLARQRGNAYDTPLVTFAVSPAINTTDRYRLRLRATGTNPVQLNAYVERWTGSVWQIIGQAAFSDGSSSRISTAGSVGFGGYIETTYRYDNFARANLATPNPAPTTSSLSPASVAAGSGAFNLTITGTNFVPQSVVRWNGADRPTTYVSPTQIQAQIAAGDVASQGSASVTVFNPAPGGGASAAQTFTVTAPANNPVPVATTLSPSSVPSGSGAFTLTVTGSGFAPSSVVRWNGANRSTTFVSATQLQAQITAGDTASSGTFNVSVVTPAPGGGTSANLPFTVTVTNPAPAITGLSPTTVEAGSPAFTLTVFGTGFGPNSVVRWNGNDRTTTFISSTEVRAAIAASDISSTGTRQVTVFNPAPGGGTSAAQSFTVTTASSNNPVPVLNQISPITVQPGSGAFQLTVLGTGFTNQSVVQWNGNARTTTFISSTELRAAINGADVAAAGLSSVRVVTPAPGGGVSTPVTFFTQNADFDLFFDGFNRPNSGTIGNGWTEKSPEAFAIQDNQLVSFVTNGGFQQDILYRPAAEDRLNVETSVEFVRLPNQTQLEVANFPQLHARIQRDNLEQPWTLDSYIFFIEDIGGDAMFAVTRSPTPGTRWECYIAAVPMTEELVVGGRYRLRFRVTGQAPVQLNGSVERYQSDGTWVTIASGSASHDESTQLDPSLYCDFPTMAPPITTAGGVGLAKWVNRSDNYDNYFWRDTEVAATPPVISSLSPATIAAGGPSFEVVVTGTGFGPDSTVRWNGSNRPTTYVDATTLRATIAASDITLPGTSSISVVNAGTGLFSNNASFEVMAAMSVETLFDNFNRANNAALGNGWIEKTANAFSLQDNVAQKLYTSNGDYRNNIVYRPAAEDTLNTEASVEFRWYGGSLGYPQVMTRAQASNIALPDTLTAYMLYINDSPTRASLARQVGGNYDVTLASITLSQALNTNDTYRLRLRAIGTNPVRLTAYVERLNGAFWEIIGQATYDDVSSDRIATPGSVGFGGYIEDTYSFDNFRRIYLGD
jgi:hypothetical protein